VPLVCINDSKEIDFGKKNYLTLNNVNPVNSELTKESGTNDKLSTAIFNNFFYFIKYLSLST